MNQDTETWDNLKQVITGSTGFEKWQRSRLVDIESKHESKQDLTQDAKLIDELVTLYLRETLETLAY